MEEKISVIIPIYKVEPYLRQCLDSVVGQTYKNLQIILVDDGSPDNCGTICDEYAAQDSRVTVIHKENGGLSSARNDALKLVTGTWISFVDPDDWCELDMYEKALTCAERTDPDIVVYSFFKESTKAHGAERRIHTFDNDFETADKDILFQLQLSALSRKYMPYSKTQPWTMGLPWDKLYRTTLVLDNGLAFAENVKAHEDVIFNIHAFQFAKKVSFVDLPLYHWRINPMSIGHKYTPNRAEVNDEIYNELLRIGKLYHMPEEYYQAVYVKIVNSTYALGLQCIYHRKNSAGIAQKIRFTKNVLQSEPTFTAFEYVERKRLGKMGKLLTISRHNNALLLFIAIKISEVLNLE